MTVATRLRRLSHSAVTYLCARCAVILVMMLARAGLDSKCTKMPTTFLFTGKRTHGLSSVKPSSIKRPSKRHLKRKRGASVLQN